jgi:hypothetical protein
MIYAQKDADGNLIATCHSKKPLEAPWFEISQDVVSSGMIWDEAQDKFINPPS